MLGHRQTLDLIVPRMRSRLGLGDAFTAEHLERPSVGNDDNAPGHPEIVTQRVDQCLSHLGWTEGILKLPRHAGKCVEIEVSTAKLALIHRCERRRRQGNDQDQENGRAQDRHRVR
jgi:hypothetical protein